MKQTNDIRNKTISIKVRQDECSLDAIDRYMVRKGYEIRTWRDGKDLVHKEYISDNFTLWYSGSYMTEKSICRFTLDGNRWDRP